MNSKKYDIFISYSSHDTEHVMSLCNYLEQHNLRCFVAHRDIPRGVVWARSIVEAIESSRMMIVVFSKAFNESEQVDREIELACEAKMPILSVRLSVTAVSASHTLRGTAKSSKATDICMIGL